MVKKTAQCGEEIGSLRGRTQPFAFDLVIIRSRQIVSHLIRGIHNFCVGVGDELLVLFGIKQYASVPVQTQAIYLLTVCDDDEMEISSTDYSGKLALRTPLSPQPVAFWQASHDRSERAVSAQGNDIFVDLELPQLLADGLVTTDIAIPILLPPTIDSNFASQFFNENFKIMVENDSPDQAAELCVVDHTGQVLFSSNPDLVGTRPVRSQLIDSGQDKPALPDKPKAE